MVGLNETTEMLPKLPIHRIQSVVQKVIKTMAKWESLRNLQPTWLLT